MGQPPQRVLHAFPKKLAAEQVVIQRNAQPEEEFFFRAPVKVEVIAPAGKEKLPLPVRELRQLSALAAGQPCIFEWREQRRYHAPLGALEGMQQIQGLPCIGVGLSRKPQNPGAERKPVVAV